MSVWVCMPSKRPPAEADSILTLWWQQGYRIALWLDAGDTSPACSDLVTWSVTYPGYAVAQNRLIAAILESDPQCDWIVSAADDIEPDINHSAKEIARECSDYFRNLHIEQTGETIVVHPTYGVMQPISDRWGDRQGAYIDRVAGSPWIGREFARRVYGGRGPYWPEYRHMFVDAEIQDVAIRLGVFWQRPDLIHMHQHWGRPKDGEQMGLRSRMPDFLEDANSPDHWNKYKAIYEERKRLNFPGHEPSV